MKQEWITSCEPAHQPEVSDSSLKWQAPVTAATPTPLAWGRCKHISPVALVTKNPSEIKVRSDQLTSRILLSLLDGKKYTKNPADRLAEYSQTLPHGRGSLRIVFSPHSEESWDHVLVSLNILGDELIDTFLVLLAVALDTHGTEYITLPFAISRCSTVSMLTKTRAE
jgi:hypothetical protein